MAGGKGSRMKSNMEKLLLPYKKPIVMHVIDAMIDSKCFDKIIAVTSSNSPNTKKYLQANRIEIFETAGGGYVEDLSTALKTIDDDVLVTSGDLPLLDDKIIKKLVQSYDTTNVWTSFVISKSYLESLQINSEFSVRVNTTDCSYSGISIVNARKIQDKKTIDENYVIVDDKRIALNLNTKQDYESLSTS